MLWSFDSGPDVPTPVTDGTLLYIVRDNGVMFCLDAKTGQEVYGPAAAAARHLQRIAGARRRQDLRDERRGGMTTVVKAGPKFEIMASNRAGRLRAVLLSTVAISEGQLFMRTSSFLWAIGERKARHLTIRPS